MNIDLDRHSHALSAVSGLALEAYRPEHVRKHVERALEREHVADLDGLVDLLGADGEARTRFRRSVAVSFSGLFRDPAQFELLERECLPALVADRSRLTVWSAGCSDGSELYSVAILLERLGALDGAFLLGSDVLHENLAAASRAMYGELTIADRIRMHVRWEQRDLLREQPARGGWRLVLCRNVAIYLTPAEKRRLYQALARSVGAGGFLMLGRSERLSEPRDLGLERVGPHVYRRVA